MEYIGDYVLAVILGLTFQYFAIAPCGGLGLRDGTRTAAKAEIRSLSVFEVGLFRWRALTAFVFYPDPHRPQHPSTGPDANRDDHRFRHRVAGQ